MTTQIDDHTLLLIGSIEPIITQVPDRTKSSGGSVGINMFVNSAKTVDSSTSNRTQ